MMRFALRRVLQAVPVLVGVSVAVFLLLHLIPGDPAQIVAGQDATVADVENVRRALGLGQPLLVQYGHFVTHLLTGDLGTSFRTGRPVAEEIAGRYVNTLALGGAALAFAVVSGMAAGIVAAVKRSSVLDEAAMLTSNLGISTPTFFLGLVLMLVFSVWLGVLPMAGDESWASFILPAVTLGASSAAVIARVMRSSLLEVLNLDYVRTARAKGVREALIIWRHAVRNAIVPVITVVGLQLGYLLGGAVVTETVFAWPGLGRLLVQSILARDFPVVQASVLLLAITFVLVNLLTDLLYGVADPRIASR